MIEIFHSLGYIHLDIKPENILIESSDFSDLRCCYFHLIDYGICQSYCNEDGSHKKQVPTNRFRGSMMFASKTAFEKTTQSRRDDLITMCYVLLKLVKGRLPWSSEQEADPN